MRETLKLFTNNSSLQESSEALLDKLGIKYSPLLRGVPFDDYFRQSGFTFHYVEELEKCIDHIWNIGYVNATTFENADANDENAKYFGLSIFACDIKPEVSFTRSMAVALTRAFNRISTQNVNNQFDMPVVVIMRQGEMLSLATCERTGRQDGHGERVGKVTILRDMNCGHLHAGHKQILERVKENVHGCKSYEELHQKWFESFNIDILSDNFFKGYKNIYEDIIEYITGKRMVKKDGKWVEQDNKNPNAEIMAEFARFDNPEKAVRDYVKNLMGRLVFIQFLQKKGWMGVPKDESWSCGDPDFLQNLFQKSEYKDDFVDKVLEPLFKDLNTSRENDLISSPNVHLGNQIKVPYLNGGLFDVSSSDSTRFKIPGKFFWNDDERYADKKPGILRLFYNYNFTIDENAPDNVEIGVDPEMLSRIFENLLEDNKEKGAFYTPKEIVQYMCRESLTAYLQTDKTENEKETIRAFVLTNDANVLGENLKEDIEEKLTNIKICDPAIGSGAFPMGMLKELYSCRRVLEGFSDKTAAEIKKHIIQNNIYGVDIEKGAVDIARLRFWLSIVVDEKTPQALPNMDFKIMQGNSLIPTFNGKFVNLTKQLRHVNSNKIRDAKKRLLKLQEEFYNAEGNYKLELHVQIKLQILEIVKLQMDYEYQQEVANSAETMDLFSTNHSKEVKVDNEKLRIVGLCLNLQRELMSTSKSVEDKAAITIPFFDWEIMFSDVFNTDKEGFDIVIGNPPYIKEYTNREAFNGFREHSPYYIGKMDIWYGFACHGIDLLNPNGILCFIAQNNWTTSSGAKLLRNKITKDARIQSLIDFNTYMVFEDASIQTMIMSFIKDKKVESYSFDYRRLLDKANRRDAIALLNKELTDYTKYSEPQIHKKDLKDKIFVFSEFDSILNKIEENKDFLLNKEIGQGIVPALDEYFILTNTSNFNDAELKYIKPYYTGIKDRYVQGETEKYLIYMSAKNFSNTSLDKYPNLESHFEPHKEELIDAKTKYGTPNKPYFFVHRERDEEFFKEGNTKIVCQTRCEYPKFICTKDAFYGSRALFFIRTTRYDMHMLTGVLNSKLVEFWLRNKGKVQGHVLKLDKEPILGIPLPSQGYINTIISDGVKALSDNHSQLTELERMKIQSDIDKEVYKIYDLKDSEIKIIESALSI